MTNISRVVLLGLMSGLLMAASECKPRVCGGIQGLTCAEGEYCDLGIGACGVADASGTCTVTPDSCTDDYTPVCGCDGITYGNACVATVAGVGIDYEGECEVEPPRCGPYPEGDICVDGEYCKMDVGVCAMLGGSGACAPIPDVCVEQVSDPVCGCDGVTYDNECQAAREGQNAAYKGACEIEPSRCGGVAGWLCAEGEYCELEAGVCANIADATGTCAVKPRFCIEQYDPVCGCDHKTYSSRCEASIAGVSVASMGRCPEVLPQ